MFHRRCLENWLKRQLSCPTCRATIDVNRRARGQDGNADQSANANQQRAANAPGGQGATPNQPQRPLQPRRQPAQRQQLPPRQEAGQQGDQNANIGEAGARLLNFANQWINQVMNEAGIRRQANAQNANAPNANNAQANHHQHHPRHQANLANMAQAQNRQAAAYANQQQAQAQNPNAFLNFHPGVAGPNALAHMQLRARRRGVLTGLRQYPHMYRVHLPPLNNAANAMNNAPIHNANPSLQRQAASSGTPEQRGVQSNANTHNEPNAPQQGVAGSASPNAASSSSTTPNPFAPVHAASSSRDAVTGYAQASPSGSGATRADSQIPGTAQTGQASQAIAAMQAGNLSGQLGGRAIAQTLPLERLFEIQRQIEVLRSEVQSLVLHATEAQLSALESEDQQNNGEAGGAAVAREGQSSITSEAAQSSAAVAREGQSATTSEAARGSAAVAREEQSATTSEAARGSAAVAREEQSATTNEAAQGSGSAGEPGANAEGEAGGVEEGGDQGDKAETEEKAGSAAAAAEASGSGDWVREDEEDSEAERIRRRRLEFLGRTGEVNRELETVLLYYNYEWVKFVSKRKDCWFEGNGNGSMREVESDGDGTAAYARSLSGRRRVDREERRCCGENRVVLN
ncbi:hypothetical protein FGB62_58g18 [Gracilaria domingensis]|nr:hypothetical protein FGB62_58g18 [Gracilaria domingensis]